MGVLGKWNKRIMLTEKESLRKIVTKNIIKEKSSNQTLPSNKDTQKN